jgi:hypothetical protein
LLETRVSKVWAKVIWLTWLAGSLSGLQRNKPSKTWLPEERLFTIPTV